MKHRKLLSLVALCLIFIMAFPAQVLAEKGEEPITLRILTRAAEAANPKESMYTKFLEEKFNVNLEFLFAPDFVTYYNLMLESKDYPDIISGALSTGQVIAGAQSGALLPLNDFIKDGTNLKAILDEYPEYVPYFTANDGNIYTFTVRSQAVHQDANCKMWYRAEWLDKLGWDHEPATTEEFKEFLIQIRDNDVNGNGDPSDEIPLMGYVSANITSSVLPFLMNSFEYYPDLGNKGPCYYITDGGDIAFTGNTDGYRKGLAYITDLYNEGLIAEETFVQDADTFKLSLNRTGEEALVGCYPFWYYGNIDRKVQSWFTYEALPPLMGDYQQTPARNGGINFDLNSAITTACKHPEKAFEIFDWMLSEEANWIGFFGFEGVTYEWVDAENFNGTSPAIKQTTYTNNNSVTWPSGTYPRFETAERRYSVIKDESVFETDNTWQLVKSSAKYAPYHRYNNFPRFNWADDDITAEYNEYFNLFSDYIYTTSVEFIMGIRDINDDKQWQDYKDELDRMGLSEYIEILKAYYHLG